MYDSFLNLAYKPFMNVVNQFTFGNIIQLLIIIGIIIFLYAKFIKGSSSEKLFKGIIMLILALLFSKLLTSINFKIFGKHIELKLLGEFIGSLVNFVLLGLIVIFQPELRKLLGYLGQPGIITKNFFTFEKESDVQNTISGITEAVKHLSKSHTGALIVIQNTDTSDSYFEVGTRINADVSTEILLTIFYPGTALHDGAVVIQGDKIVSAGVLLPLTEDPKLSWQYGTRHRAAIGMSEVSDAACIVVSEETGDISLAQGGTLNKFVSSDELKIELEYLYGLFESQPERPKSQSKFKIFSGEQG